MTNEERFIASCENVGEADVRQKLGAGRYSEHKAVWASSWLDRVESGKSDATKAEERSSSLRKSASPKRYVASAVSALVFVLLVAGGIIFLNAR
jgi:hypothetical protein